MPWLIRPMLASPSPGLPRDNSRYGWEFKWDGVRAIAYLSGGRLGPDKGRGDVSPED
jgi:ATP-dependent DNA ligase